MLLWSPRGARESIQKVTDIHFHRGGEKIGEGILKAYLFCVGSIATRIARFFFGEFFAEISC